MNTLDAVVAIIEEYCIKEKGRYQLSGDDSFDISVDIARKVMELWFGNTKLVRDSNLNEHLWCAVEGYIQEITDKIRYNQSKERTIKIAEIVTKRARRILDRIK